MDQTEEREQRIRTNVLEEMESSMLDCSVVKPV